MKIHAKLTKDSLGADLPPVWVEIPPLLVGIICTTMPDRLRYDFKAIYHVSPGTVWTIGP